MNLIKINLYPNKQGEQNKVFTLADNYFTYAYATLLLFIGLNIILILFYLFLGVPHANLEKKWQKMQPAAEKIDSLKAGINQLQQKKDKYSGLLTAEVNTARMLASIFKSTPKNIWLDSLAYEKEVISVEGYAVYWEGASLVAVDKLIDRLKNNQYISRKFKNIKLISSRKVYINSQEVVKFKLECQGYNG